MILKTCVPSAMCIVGSLNFGTTRVKVESICCASELCNNESPPGNHGNLTEACFPKPYKTTLLTAI